MRVKYFVEGSDDEALILALQVTPAKVPQGKISVINVTQEIIQKSIIAKVDEDTVIFVYDTDAGNPEKLQQNIKNVSRYKKLILWRQVRNLEEMLVRATDIKDVRELTKSKSKSNFKTAFHTMDSRYLRKKLEEHKIDVKKLWERGKHKSWGAKRE